MSRTAHTASRPLQAKRQPPPDGAHAFDERTSLDDLRRCTLTIAALIADWSGTAPR